MKQRRECAKASNGSLQGEFRAPIDEATGTPRSLTLDEIVAKVSKLGLARRDEAVRLIRDDRRR